MSKEELLERLDLLKSKYNLDVFLRNELLMNLRGVKKLQGDPNASHDILMKTFEKDISKLDEMIQKTCQEFSDVKKLLKSLANCCLEQNFSQFSFFVPFFSENLFYWISPVLWYVSIAKGFYHFFFQKKKK